VAENSGEGYGLFADLQHLYTKYLAHIHCMRSISLILKQFSKTVLLLAGLSVLGFSAQAQVDAAKGATLFNSKCTTCHKLDVKVVEEPADST